MHQKLTEPEAAELKLDSYLMHIHRTKCACGSHEKYHTIYEVWTHPTKTKTTGFRDLRPAVRSTLRDLPIAYINLPFRLIPICSDCVRDHSCAGAIAFEAASAAEWAETLKRKYTPPSAGEIKIARSTGAAPSDKTIPAPTPDQL